MLETVEAKTKPVEIGIELDKQGQFVYRPALQQANPDDSITWSCKAGDFTVSFPERSPFDSVTIHGVQGVPTKAEPLRKNVEPGVYHYHVALAVPTPNGKAIHSGEVTILVDSGCPGVEVSRSHSH